MTMLVASSSWQGSAFADQDTMAAHEYAGKDQNGGHQAKERPNHFSENAESAEMQVREPCKDQVPKTELIV